MIENTGGIYMKLTRKTVKELCVALTKATLEFTGYELTDVSGYLLAQFDEKTPLLIYCLGKQFSSDESSTYKADGKALAKLERFVESYPETVIPCIAYGFTKGNISSFETVIVSVEDIRELARVGGVFSDAGGHLHLNTDLTSDLPQSAIYKKWKLIE